MHSNISQKVSYTIYKCYIYIYKLFCSDIWAHFITRTNKKSNFLSKYNEMNCNCYVWNCLLSIRYKIFHTEWKENEFSVLFHKIPFIYDFKMQKRNKQKYFIIYKKIFKCIIYAAFEILRNTDIIIYHRYFE